MSDKQKAAAAGEKAAPTTEAPKAPLTLHCKVLVNGMLYRDAHHAAGKSMTIPQPEAEYLAGMKPPQVEIIGVN